MRSFLQNKTKKNPCFCKYSVYQTHLPKTLRMHTDKHMRNVHFLPFLKTTHPCPGRCRDKLTGKGATRLRAVGSLRQILGPLGLYILVLLPTELESAFPPNPGVRSTGLGPERVTDLSVHICGMACWERSWSFCVRKSASAVPGPSFILGCLGFHRRLLQCCYRAAEGAVDKAIPGDAGAVSGCKCAAPELPACSPRLRSPVCFLVAKSHTNRLVSPNLRAGKAPTGHAKR